VIIEGRVLRLYQSEVTMSVSRGKEFEKNFENSTKSLISSGANITIDRLYDVVGKKTIKQPSDYICYFYPNQIYVECKSTHDDSFSYFTQPQYERLAEKSNIRGIKAGMLVWFVTNKRVFWVDIDWMTAYYDSRGVKSFTVARLEQCVKNNISGVYEVEQQTKRINPEMNLKGLYNYIVNSNI